jgi:SAM-dependent methyltransferase
MTFVTRHAQPHADERAPAPALATTDRLDTTEPRRRPLLARASRFTLLARRDGLRATALMAFAVGVDHVLNPFDRKNGTETGGYVPKSLIRSGALGSHATEGSSYVASNTMSFRRFLKQTFPQPRGRFIDYGCGKGRVVLLAAQHGFRSVSGVEHSPELVAEANMNVAIAQARRDNIGEIAIHQGDAAQWAFPDDASVAFFYNPFELPVVERVLDNIDRSIEVAPRSVVVVFQSFPNDATDIPSALTDRLDLERVVQSWGKRYHVFRTAA